jgi:2,4-dienoyl-CoA reductase-like NADH-dependent reductase (Old Yellow Enzyme family)
MRLQCVSDVIPTGRVVFERLFSPLTIGPLTLKNRIVMAPHGMVFTAGYGSSVERVIDYHVERARGGAGLIVMSNFLFPPSWRRLATWGGALETSPLGTLDRIDDHCSSRRSRSASTW